MALWHPPRARLADALDEIASELPLDEVRRLGARLRPRPDLEGVLDLIDKALLAGGESWDGRDEAMVWKGVALCEAGRHEDCIEWVRGHFGKHLGALGSEPYFTSLARLRGAEAAMGELDRIRAESTFDFVFYEAITINILEVAGPSEDLDRARERLRSRSGPLINLSRISGPESRAWLLVWAVPILMTLLYLHNQNSLLAVAVWGTFGLVVLGVLAAASVPVSFWVSQRVLRFAWWRRRLARMDSLRRLSGDRLDSLARTMAAA